MGFSKANYTFPAPITVDSNTLRIQAHVKKIVEKWYDTFLEYSLDSANVEILCSSHESFHDTVRFFRRLKNAKLSFVYISLLLLSDTHEIITFDKALAKEIRKRRIVDA